MAVQFLVSNFVESFSAKTGPKFGPVTLFAPVQPSVHIRLSHHCILRYSVVTGEIAFSLIKEYSMGRLQFLGYVGTNVVIH